MSKNSYSASIVLDTRRIKSDGTYPLKLRIIVNRSSFHIHLGQSIEKKIWQEDKESVLARRGSGGSTTRLNNFLLKKKTEAADKLLKLDEEGKLGQLSPEEIKAVLSRKEKPLMILEWADTLIQQLKEAKRFGNARIYEDTKRSIGNFLKGKDISILRIDYSWLRKYEAWYYARGNAVNGLSVYLRTLRAMYNRAIKEKLISGADYPFREYKIENQETRKRAIKQNALTVFMGFEPRTKRHKRARDYFLLSLWMAGASFVDLAFLRIANIIEGRIEYTRQKTGRLHSIIITEPLQQLLAPYLQGKSKDDYILDIIRISDPEKQLTAIRDELRRYNKSLKEISRLCGIEIPLTSYVARHSYATLSKIVGGIPVAVISQQLGHANEKQTQDYLDSFENEVLDNYHTMIVGKLAQNGQAGNLQAG